MGYRHTGRIMVYGIMKVRTEYEIHRVHWLLLNGYSTSLDKNEPN